VNLRRGLFRLWAAVSVAWIILAGWYSLLLLYPSAPGDMIPVLTEGRIMAAVRLMFGPPLLVLAVVFAPLWVWDGFKPHKKSN